MVLKDPAAWFTAVSFGAMRSKIIVGIASSGTSFLVILSRLCCIHLEELLGLDF